MEKRYYNPSLIKYFERHISKMKVHENFKPLLVEVLLRRAYEYELTPSQITQDMLSLKNSLEVIEIGKIPKKNKNALRYILS